MNRFKLSTNSLTVFAALLLLFLFVLAYNAYGDNIHATHSGPEAENCLDSGCHAGIHTRETMDPNIPDAHVIMLGEVPGKEEDDGEPDKNQCVFCHTAPVDLVQAAGTPVPTTANLRKHVDIRLCVLCHGREAPSGIEHKQFYQVTFAELDPAPDGAELYGLVCSGCHRPIGDSKVGGESASDIQEAIDKDEGGMSPLNVLTTAQITQIANALATSRGGNDDSEDDD